MVSLIEVVVVHTQHVAVWGRCLCDLVIRKAGRRQSVLSDIITESHRTPLIAASSPPYSTWLGISNPINTINVCLFVCFFWHQKIMKQVTSIMRPIWYHSFVPNMATTLQLWWLVIRYHTLNQNQGNTISNVSS